MNPRIRSITKQKYHLLLLLLILGGLSACTANKQLRTDHVTDNCLLAGVDCRRSAIERYLEYDLGFIEFTERGNVYDRTSNQRVFSLIREQAENERGVAVFVFVHGWKHNARFDDSNVVQFREFLSRAAENEVVGKRKVIGLYLGWRGAFTNIPFLKETTYWARKSVAEEIGAGGVTEVLSELHQILVSDTASASQQGLYKNTFVVIGHSFGGAIVLSALHDVLLNDLVSASNSITGDTAACEKVNRFADALILLNPAIEANKVVLLKEAAARCQFSKGQATLMHILSSDGDRATQVFFPIGEYLNVTSPLGPKKLKRKVIDKTIVLDERQMTLVTAGNLKQFRTDYLSFNREDKHWTMNKCADNLDNCGVVGAQQQANHFTVANNDPLAFIKTDRTFIKDHNDAFSCYVQSFITSVVYATQVMEHGGFSNTQTEDSARACEKNNQFDFMQCFNDQIDDYSCDPS